MKTETVQTFRSLSENVGQYNLRGKILLIPEMNRISCRLLAGVFRGFGIRAQVMETYKGLDLGMEYTSGKECYPCQVTLGDILHFMRREKERLGADFIADEYIYFMPESEGPCRFGMYNKFQRIVLDSFPELRNLKIGTLTTGDAYSLDGIIDRDLVGDLRKASYFSVVAADIMDRLLWRVRPYEKEEGMADDFIEKAVRKMEDAFEKYGVSKAFDKILDSLEEVIEEGRSIMDQAILPKPLIGMVGEIYLRCHTHSNQDIIRLLERHGAEVVNASIAEWVNFVGYNKLREARQEFRLNLKQFRLGFMWAILKRLAHLQVELQYQEFRQRQVYERARSLIDLAGDHSVGHLYEVLKENDLFCFDTGTEACLSIPGILEYARSGFNGVVNVYPFTCMPSTVTSAVVRPMMNRLKIPYLDAPYDSSFQPGRETAIRTFMYQAVQHMKRNGRRNHSESHPSR